MLKFLWKLSVAMNTRDRKGGRERLEDKEEEREKTENDGGRKNGRVGEISAAEVFLLKTLRFHRTFLRINYSYSFNHFWEHCAVGKYDGDSDVATSWDS